MARSLFLSIALLLLTASAVRADVYVFALRGGGEVEGEWLNSTELPRRNYVIKTELGEVTLPRDAVTGSPVRRRPAEVELDKIRHDYPDTAEGQWELAEWCRLKGLTDAKKQFLQRVIELDPEHVAARRALGHNRINGKWQSVEELQTSRGYVHYRGKWMLPQEVDALKRVELQNQEKKLWYQKIDLWCGWYLGNRSDEGKKKLLAINDPLAVEALSHRMNAEQPEAVRLLVTEILATIASDAAFKVLAERSLDDPSPEVRLTCVDYLAKASRPAVVKLFLDKLKDKDNTVINRAAFGLRRLNDPSAIAGLIDALVTKHKILVSQGTPSGSTSATFGPGGGGFAVGGGGPIYLERPYQNQEVLDALIALTGANFNFDPASWKQWYAAQRRARGV